MVPPQPNVEASLVCVRKSRRELSVIKDERVTRKLLAHLGLPEEAPKQEPAPEEPQRALWPTGSLADDFTQPPSPDEDDQRWSTIDSAE